MIIDNKYENKIPVLEGYLNTTFTGFIDITSNLNEYYFLLENDENNNKYILRIDDPLSKYKIVSCGAGGHGGLIYGRGGNGGRHIIIDNITNGRLLNRGSYLISIGKTSDIITKTNIQTKINEIITDGAGGAYVNIYKHNISGEFFSLTHKEDIIRNYRKVDWKTSDVSSYIFTNEQLLLTNENMLNRISPSITDIANLTFEIIFILKGGNSIMFPDFSSLSSSFSRRIFVVKEKNTDITNEITNNSSFTYTNGSTFDQLITILFYKNNTINDVDSSTQIKVKNLIDFSMNASNKFYIYNYNNESLYVDLINYYNNENNNILSLKQTVIKYDENPSASLSELEGSMYSITLEGGTDALMYHEHHLKNINNNYLIRLFYLDRGSIIGGESGQDSHFNKNLTFFKLGGNQITSIRMDPNPQVYENSTDFVYIYPYNTKITVGNRRPFKYWIGSRGGYISNPLFNFNLTSKIINNRNISNGGNTGYWQFIKSGVDIKQGANGYNEFNTNEIGYGSGGYGGSFLLSGGGNSLFNSTKGKNGVFILSFSNNKSSLIVNYNANIISEMYNLFIISNSKLTYLRDINTIINENDNYIINLIKNSFIVNLFNLELDLTDGIKTRLNEKINKQEQLNKIIGIIYIIQRVFFLLVKNLKNINKDDINNIVITFVDNETQEYVNKINTNLQIGISNSIQQYYLKNTYFNYNTTTYKNLCGFNDINNINIQKGNTNTNPNPNPEINFIEQTLSSIYEIKYKDYLINFTSLEVIYNIIQYNLILYAIFYKSYIYNPNYTTREDINITYNNLYLFTEHIKSLNSDSNTENNMKFDKNNIIKKQNDFKTYFYNGLNDYDLLKDNNKDKINKLNAYKDFYSSKMNIYKNSTILLIIVYIILIVLFFWFVYMMSYFDEYDTIPYAFIILLIVISVIILLHYNYYYYYQEKFTMTISQNANEISGTKYTNNNENYILHEIIPPIANAAATEIKIKNYMEDITFMFITNKTIHIYDNNFINTDMIINTNYTVNFSNNNINLIQTNNNTNININTNTGVAGTGITRNVYYNNVLIIPNYTGTNGTINMDASINDNNNIIKNILNITSAFTITDKNINSYGTNDNNPVFIITYKDISIDNINYNIQYFINKYNNNISKLLIDKFNDIYILDNQTIYDNAKNSFKNALLLENDASTLYKNKQINIKEGSSSSLTDVYMKYEIIKSVCYLFLALILFYLIYSLNPNHRTLIILGFILVFVLIIVSLFYRIHIYNTRRDYYKYYWGNSL